MSFFQDEGGGTAIEYGLIAALISVVIIGAITAVGTVNTIFNAITTTTLASPVATGIATRP